MDWKDHNKWEQNWWGSCQNTYWEETKQRVYARKMGLQEQGIDGKFPVYDMKGKSVLDIGGGPVSLLLKCINIPVSLVIDPCPYPKWVAQRYKLAGIGYSVVPAEEVTAAYVYDECYVYNVCQHVIDPQKIIDLAKKSSRIIRLFEWIDTYVSEGHPHVLTEDKLNLWLGGEGKVEILNESGCHGKAYYGVFKGLYFNK